MLSGRYVTDHRARHFDQSNPSGACRLCPLPEAGGPGPAGDLPHQLLYCEALAQARTRVVQLWSAHLVDRPHLLPIVTHHTLGSEQDRMAFLLDPSSCSLVIAGGQVHGQVVYQDCHYLSRVWCHGTHVLRMKLLKMNGIL